MSLVALLLRGGRARAHPLARRLGKIPVTSHRNLQYGWTAYLLGDRASAKFNPYSKVFTVDGNLHSGTAKLAQQVAETLDRWPLQPPNGHVTYTQMLDKDSSMTVAEFRSHFGT